MGRDMDGPEACGEGSKDVLLVVVSDHHRRTAGCSQPGTRQLERAGHRLGVAEGRGSEQLQAGAPQSDRVELRPLLCLVSVGEHTHPAHGQGPFDQIRGARARAPVLSIQGEVSLEHRVGLDVGEVREFRAEPADAEPALLLEGARATLEQREEPRLQAPPVPRGVAVRFDTDVPGPLDGRTIGRPTMVEQRAVQVQQHTAHVVHHVDDALTDPVPALREASGAAGAAWVV